MSGAPVPEGNPAPPDEVKRIFDRVAGRYDVLNTLMTGAIDARWRRAAIRAAELRAGDRVLDVACGTGKLARAAAARVGPGGRVVGVDVSEEMLRRARRVHLPRGGSEVSYAVGDALALPFADAAFDAVTIGFGLRNLANYLAGLREMARVAAPGGRVVVLEIGEPRRALPRLLFRTWFTRAVPFLGRLFGLGPAYRYLVGSLARYPTPEEVAELMRRAGLVEVSWRWLASGLVTLHVGRRPGVEREER